MKQKGTQIKDKGKKELTLRFTLEEFGLLEQKAKSEGLKPQQTAKRYVTLALRSEELIKQICQPKPLKSE